MESAKKLRILCLHGYHQNKNSFRQKTGSFRKPLKKYADFEFLDAPHLVRENDSQDDSADPAYLQKISADTSEGRGWWIRNSPVGDSGGLQESLDVFEEALVTNGPFDGVMGFSQGAAFLALACILLQEKLKPIKFVILVAGFKSPLSAHSQFYELKTKLSIPSLHVIGESDEISSPDRSRLLLKEVFDNGKLALHPGGHYVPATKEFKDVYKNFILQFYNK